MSLQRLHDLDRSSAQFPEQLDKLLHDKEYVDGLLGLPEPELNELVNHLNNILIRLDRTGGSSRKCLHVLRKICGSRKVLPTTYNLSGDISSIRQSPDAFGGFGDAYEGTLSVRVCIKRLKISATSDLGKIEKMFRKEAVVWKRLNHPNIVPFRGVTFDPLQLISEWMPGGELRDYVKKNWDTDLISLSLGVAEGLGYLHSREVIHGDFKGSNIMVDESGNARITDFGLAIIARDSNSLTSTSNDQTQAYRWTAPEVLGAGEGVTKASDVFSLGMVIIEVFTGEVPFHRVKSAEMVMLTMTGQRPGRPNHPKFTTSLWTLTQRCWVAVAQDRPKMEEVIKVLEELANQANNTDHGAHLERSTDRGGTIPSSYVIDTPIPGSESLPPPNSSNGGDYSAHQSIPILASGITDKSSSRRPFGSGPTNLSGNGSDRRKSQDPVRLDTEGEITSDNGRNNKSGDQSLGVQSVEARRELQDSVGRPSDKSDNLHVIGPSSVPERTVLGPPKRHGLWCRVRALLPFLTLTGRR